MSIDDDMRLALELLQGRLIAGPDIQYLSARTKPTEKEARAALARVLLILVKELQNRPAPGHDAGRILAALAYLFDPNANRSSVKRFWNNRTVDFRNISTGNTKAWKDLRIAIEVELAREDLGKKEKAIESVANDFGMTVRHVKRIIKKEDVNTMLESDELMARLEDLMS